MIVIALPPVDDELALATKRCVPSVLTMSGSSTPWTWTLVPVNEGEETDETAVCKAVAAPATVMVALDAIVSVMVTRPPTNIAGPPMNDDPP